MSFLAAMTRHYGVSFSAGLARQSGVSFAAGMTRQSDVSIAAGMTLQSAMSFPRKREPSVFTTSPARCLFLFRCPCAA